MLISLFGEKNNHLQSELLAHIDTSDDKIWMMMIVIVYFYVKITNMKFNFPAIIVCQWTEILLQFLLRSNDDEIIKGSPTDDRNIFFWPYKYGKMKNEFGVL